MFRVHVTLLWVKAVHTMLCTVVYECGCVCVWCVCVCQLANSITSFCHAKQGFVWCFGGSF